MTQKAGSDVPCFFLELRIRDSGIILPGFFLFYQENMSMKHNFPGIAWSDSLLVWRSGVQAQYAGKIKYVRK